ncbi:hypothetical protein LWI28_012150 [Acer negundo]|uniref:Pentatricopeptide repeat-containing protein n=1 Tax=Acer negundo TaxID=4023 RepID=A0AAD5J4C7_ACENE|nr:hypothetical protein LWI28_012150 [Acer negundo]
MRAYAAHGKIGVTCHVFDEITDKNVVFINVMINRFFSDDLLVFKTVSSCDFKPDNYTYPCLLKACSGLNSFWVGLQTHGVVVKVGLDSNMFIANGLVSIDLSALLLGSQIHQYVERKKLRLNLLLENALIDMYAMCGSFVEARIVFDDLKFRDILSWTSMISAYGMNEERCDAVALFLEIQNSGLCPDSIAFDPILSACCHSRIRMVSMFGKCGSLVEARRVLNEMPSRDVVSWNSMVSGYVQSGRFDDMLEVCREMESLRLKPDIGTMASVLLAMNNTSSESVSYVKEIFLNLAKKNLVSWNVMIADNVNSLMPVEAVDLYSQMDVQGIKSDAIFVASILPACRDLSALLLGRQIHQYVERKKLRPNSLLENALIDMYAKCGSFVEARTVFDDMIFMDVVSWTSMISAYGMSGKGCNVVALFSKMQNSSLCPVSIAFASVISSLQPFQVVGGGAI